MKRSTTVKNVTLCLFALIPAFASAQVTIEEWVFDDANGTSINEATNSGIPGDWVFSGGLSDQQAAVTDGVMRFFGASTREGILNSAASGDAVLSTGVYEFSFTISDFNFSGPNNLGWVQWLIKSGGSNLVIFRVQESPNDTLRVWVRSGNGGEFYDLAGVNSTPRGSITISASLDVDDQSFTFSIDSFNDSFDLVSTGPLPFNGAGDITGVAVASQFNTATTDSSDYLDFGEIRFTGPEIIIESGTWAGYEIDENGWINTGNFMGWLNVDSAPWILSSSLDRWIYMPEEFVSDTGAWAYAGNY